uniref:General odorant-binding protein 45 n=1 Tax=Culex pipiens TaxID=7175 RepID=A0A8D8H8K3_CULPI
MELLLLTLLVMTVSGSQHSATFKSICSADRECSHYSRDPNCATRCRGLVTRFWNDTTGLPDATISRFYEPRHPATEERCIKDVIVRSPAWDSCRRAELVTNCYEQWSNDSRLAFVPFTNLQLLQNLQECIDILRLGPDIVSAIARDGILSCPEGRCLFRSFLIRSGLYSDSAGPILDRITVQCVSGYGQELNVQNFDSCVAKLRREYGLDKCSLAARVVVECLQVNLDITPSGVGFLPYGVYFQFYPRTAAALIKYKLGLGGLK